MIHYYQMNLNSNDKDFCGAVIEIHIHIRGQMPLKVRSQERLSIKNIEAKIMSHVQHFSLVPILHKVGGFVTPRF